MVFTFDTGASKTWLYKRYFDENRAAVEKYPLTRVGVGGAGKTDVFDAYYIDFHLKIDDAVFGMDSVTVLPNYPVDPENDFYGNFGQDLMSSFETMTMNFRDMSIHFE